MNWSPTSKIRASSAMLKFHNRDPFTKKSRPPLAAAVKSSVAAFTSSPPCNHNPCVANAPVMLGAAECFPCFATNHFKRAVCATCALKGKEACKGRSIPMDRLDRLVTERIVDQLLTAERIGRLLGGLMDRQAKGRFPAPWLPHAPHSIWSRNGRLSAIWRWR